MPKHPTTPSSSPAPAPGPVPATPVVPQMWVIDRVDGEIASIEIDGHAVITVPLWLLPRGTGEGDVLRVAIQPDEAEKQRRLAQSRAQLARAPKSGPAGDIVL